ncbi:MAG: PAS domain S-box protein [Methylococcaceae bacterium]
MIKQEGCDHLHKIVSQLPGMVYQFRLYPDGHTCFPYVSEGIRDIYRLNPEDVREDASKIYALTYPDDYDDLWTSLHQSAQKLTLWNHEFRVQLADGTLIWLLGKATPEREADGATLWHGIITNITEHKEIEVTLRRSEKLLSIITASSHDAMIMLDKAGLISFWNEAAEKIFGYARAEVLGQNLHAMLTPLPFMKDHLRAFPHFQKTGQGKFIGTTYEVSGLRKGGIEFPMELSLSAVQTEEGWHSVGIVRDISRRKQAEEKLVKASALQNAIFNSANFSSIATDAKGVIQIFNVGAERMLGYTADEVLNKITPADISDPEEIIAHAKTLTQELKTPIAPGFEALVFKASRGIEDIYELTYIRKDGSRFPAIVSVTALRDAQDAIIGYLLIGTDNTARKQIESDQILAQHLRDLQFYTRSLIEANIDALITTDSAGIITDANQQTEALTGYTRNELIGTAFKNYFTDQEQAEAAIRQVLSEMKIYNYELTMLGKDGKETPVSYNATTFYDQNGKLQGVVASARNMTERKLLDQALLKKHAELQRAKLGAEKANLAKSEFLSSMSHELRSPLNAILGFAQLLESDSPPPTLLQTESINQIIEAGWHLLTLINEILDLAKIESGQTSLSQESVSLSDIIPECYTMMEPMAQQFGIQMLIPHVDAHHVICADRFRVKQVLINLISNAIKYNSQPGTVEVQCTENTQGYIRVSVRDTGAGLHPEQLMQLFQPFNRLGQESSNREGTGIGLVVAKQLVELMGGTIGVDSSIGGGSVFWIELPVMTERLHPALKNSATVSLPSPPEALKAPRQTLLYIEDNPANLKLVQQVIARHPNLRLLTAVNATSGIQIARSLQPEVILIDINLPGINGIEALHILHSDSSTAHITVIALSANAMPEDIEKGLKAGFFSYITKPINVKIFMATLDSAFALVKRDKS